MLEEAHKIGVLVHLSFPFPFPIVRISHRQAIVAKSTTSMAPAAITAASHFYVERIKRHK